MVLFYIEIYIGTKINYVSIVIKIEFRSSLSLYIIFSVSVDMRMEHILFTYIFSQARTKERHILSKAFMENLIPKLNNYIIY